MSLGYDRLDSGYAGCHGYMIALTVDMLGWRSYMIGLHTNLDTQRNKKSRPEFNLGRLSQVISILFLD